MINYGMSNIRNRVSLKHWKQNCSCWVSHMWYTFRITWTLSQNELIYILILYYLTLMWGSFAQLNAFDILLVCDECHPSYVQSTCKVFWFFLQFVKLDQTVAYMWSLVHHALFLRFWKEFWNVFLCIIIEPLLLLGF